jgi:hypothetical protein
MKRNVSRNEALQGIGVKLPRDIGFSSVLGIYALYSVHGFPVSFGVAHFR